MGKIMMYLAVAAFVTAPAFANKAKADKKANTKTSCTSHQGHDHAHGKDCGHESVEHEGHADYKHDGHLHAEHGGHYDEHKSN